MAVTTLAGIAHRAATVWPLGSVPYSMAATGSPTGHRQDCSGYASACLGLPPPGESTVTLVTRGLVRPIGWDEMRPGDLVGRMGPGTEGAAGHVMVVVAVTDRMYTVLEQRGGVPGPVRGIYQMGGPAGYRPYRSVAVSIEEDDMPLTDVELARIALYVLQGSDDRGYPPASLPEPVRRALAERNLAAQAERLAARAATGVDMDSLADMVAARVTGQIAAAVAAAADRLTQRAAE
jgi:hypothetical protein